MLGRMQFTLHANFRTPHGASRLVQAISTWLVKTRNVLRPDIAGMPEGLWSYDYGHAQIKDTPPEMLL